MRTLTHQPRVQVSLFVVVFCFCNSQLFCVHSSSCYKQTRIKLRFNTMGSACCGQAQPYRFDAAHRAVIIKAASKWHPLELAYVRRRFDSAVAGSEDSEAVNGGHHKLDRAAFVRLFPDLASLPQVLMVAALLLMVMLSTPCHLTRGCTCRCASSQCALRSFATLQQIGRAHV